MKKFMLIATLMVASLCASAQGVFIKPMAGGTVTTMTGDVEDGMACNLMISIVIFWPICFVLDVYMLIRNLLNK